MMHTIVSLGYRFNMTWAAAYYRLNLSSFETKKNAQSLDWAFPVY